MLLVVAVVVAVVVMVILLLMRAWLSGRCVTWRYCVMLVISVYGPQLFVLSLPVDTHGCRSPSAFPAIRARIIDRGGVTSRCITPQVTM